MRPLRPARTALSVWALVLVGLTLAASVAALSAPPAPGRGATEGLGPRYSGTVLAAAGGPNSVIASIPVPVTSGGATFDPGDGRVYVGAGGTNLTAINGTTNTVQRSWYLGPYANPETPTVVPSADAVFVPQQSLDPPPDNVTDVNTATGAWVSNLSTGLDSSPAPATYDPANGRLYVPDYASANLTVITVAGPTVTATVPVGRFPFTPAYDPADGDLYVPNTGSGNVSVVSAATNTVVATIAAGAFPFEGSETAISGGPVYDPVSQEVYQPNPAGTNLSVLRGTVLVENISVGAGMGTPMVDPVTGDLYVPVDLTSTTSGGENDTVVVVDPTTNAVVRTITVGYGPNTPAYDPANQEIYVSNTIDDTVSVVNATTFHVDATIAVGVNPGPATYDSANEEVYVPDPVSANISVIAAGPIPTASPPGTYTVTFTESGLPAGAWWNVALGGTTLNQSTPSISFYAVADGAYAFSVGPWDDASTCQYASLTGGGTVVVHGANQSVAVPFDCTGSPFFPNPAPALFFGLAGLIAYLVIGAILLVIVIVVVIVVLVVGHRPPAPPAAGYPPPPYGYYAPPPPPPPPAPPPPPP